MVINGAVNQLVMAKVTIVVKNVFIVLVEHHLLGYWKWSLEIEIYVSFILAHTADGDYNKD